MNFIHTLRRTVLSLLMMVAFMLALPPAFAAAIEPSPPSPAMEPPLPAYHLVGTFNPQALARGLSAGGNTSAFEFALSTAATRYLSIDGSNLAFNGNTVKDHATNTTIMVQVADSAWYVVSVGDNNSVVDLGKIYPAGSGILIWLYPTTNATNLTLDMYPSTVLSNKTGHPTN